MSEGRENHVNWCRARAQAYLDANDLTNAVASMVSDLSKRKDTECHSALAMMGVMLVTQQDRAGVQRWIDGFR